jgi:hypothetical protein
VALNLLCKQEAARVLQQVATKLGQRVDELAAVHGARLDAAEEQLEQNLPAKLAELGE